MDNVLKFVFFVFFIYLMMLAGYHLFAALNNKIKGAQNGWQLLLFSLLLFSACALLLVGGLYGFIEVYAFLVRPNS